MGTSNVDSVNVQITGSVAPLVEAMQTAADSVAETTAAMGVAFDALGREVIDSTRAMGLLEIEALKMDADLAATGYQAKEAAVGFEEVSVAIKGVTETIETVLGPLLAIFAVFKALDIITETITNTVELAQSLQVLHEKTGVAVEDLSALQYAAKLSEVSTETLTVSLQRLARGAEETAKGGAGPAADAFKAVGVSATTASGQLRPMDDLLLSLADKFKTLPDGTAKTALAMDLFGRSGANLIPLLNRGRDGIAELEAEARRLGATMSEKDVVAALEYEEALKKLKAQWDGVVRVVVESVLPILTKVLDTFRALIDVEEAFEHASKALALAVVLAPKAAAQEWEKAKTAMQNALDEFKDRTPAQSEGSPGPAPIITPKGGPTTLEVWRGELDKIKIAKAGSNADLLFLEIEFWQRKLALTKDGSKDQLEVLAALASAQTQLADRAAREEAERIKKIQSDWMGAFALIPKAWNNAFNDMEQRGTNFAGFMRDLWYSLVADGAKAVYSMTATWAAGELTKKNLTVSSVLARAAAEVAGAVRIIAAYAAQAAAAAWAWTTATLGPWAGPAAAAATLVGVLALANNIGSGGGNGSGNGGGGGSSQPASSAQPAASNGGRGDTYIYALDAKSFADFAHANPAGFAAGVKSAVKSGALTPRKLGLG